MKFRTTSKRILLKNRAFIFRFKNNEANSCKEFFRVEFHIFKLKETLWKNAQHLIHKRSAQRLLQIKRKPFFRFILTNCFEEQLLTGKNNKIKCYVIVTIYDCGGLKKSYRVNW